MILDEIIEFEKLYEQNDYTGLLSSNNTFKITRGTIPILLSAPHSVRQKRNESLKVQDMMTGGLVDYIQSVCNCYSIINICTYGDPNFDNIDNCLYKQKILQLIKEHDIQLVIDFHGLDSSKDSYIDICTNDNKTICNHYEILESLLNLLDSNLGNVSINKYYNADLNFCIANYISSVSGVPCIELEINRLLRNPYDSPQYIISLCDCLVRFIKHFKNL